MKTAALLTVSLLILLHPVASSAQKAPCKSNPKVVAACYSIRGRLSMGADTARLRLWPVGTKRMLAVTDGPMLDDANGFITPAGMQFPDIDKDIYGDFTVCPFTPEQKDHMQMVCIESARHLVTKSK